MSTILLEDVSYSVAGKEILKGINMEINEGEIISIMGQSGSGKTTLLKLMTGLRCPTAGRIVIDDMDIACLPDTELEKVRLKVGLVFQYAALLDSLSVRDNILFGLMRHDRRIKRKEQNELVDKLLTEVQLDPNVAPLFPSQLSGGMQKRVGLARALAMKPSILFYDEPTSGLDPITSFAIDSLIVSTRDQNNVTSVVVSHQLSSVFRISDRIALIDKGIIHAFGTAAELRSSPDEIVREFLLSDAESISNAGEHLATNGN